MPAAPGADADADADEIGIRAAELRAGFLEAGFALGQVDDAQDRRRLRRWAELGATPERIAIMVERAQGTARARIHAPVAYLHDKVVSELSAALRAPDTIGAAADDDEPEPDPLAGLHTLDASAVRELLDAWRIVRALERSDASVRRALMRRSELEGESLRSVSLAAADALGVGVFPHLPRVLRLGADNTESAS